MFNSTYHIVKVTIKRMNSSVRLGRVVACPRNIRCPVTFIHMTKGVVQVILASSQLSANVMQHHHLEQKQV